MKLKDFLDEFIAERTAKNPEFQRLVEEAAARRRIATPPGEVLAEEFLKPMGMSVENLARTMGVPAADVRDVVDGHKDVSGETP